CTPALKPRSSHLCRRKARTLMTETSLLRFYEKEAQARELMAEAVSEFTRDSAELDSLRKKVALIVRVLEEQIRACPAFPAQLTEAQFVVLGAFAGEGAAGTLSPVADVNDARRTLLRLFDGHLQLMRRLRSEASRLVNVGLSVEGADALAD